MKTNRIPILLEVPHNGRNIPEIALPFLKINRSSLDQDIDEHTEVYSDHQNKVNSYIDFPIYRTIVDVNRIINAGDHGNDLIKYQTMATGEEVFQGNHLPENIIQELVDNYYKPYIANLLQMANRPDNKAIFFGHTMLVEPNSFSIKKTKTLDKNKRPLFIVANGGKKYKSATQEQIAIEVKSALQSILPDLHLDQLPLDDPEMIKINERFPGRVCIERIYPDANSMEKPCIMLEIRQDVLGDIRNKSIISDFMPKLFDKITTNLVRQV